MYLLYSGLASTWHKAANEAANKYDRAVCLSYYYYYVKKAHKAKEG